MHKFKVGIVGAGNIATSAHLPAYTNELKDRVDVVAIADINEERAKQTAKAWNIPNAYGSVDDLIKNADVDFIDCCTWNSAHEEIVVKSMKAGIPAICEKPMSSSLDGAKRMAESVKKAKKPFMMAMVARYGPNVELLTEKIEAGEFGKIYLAKTGHLRRRGAPIGWFTDKRKSGGGPIIDIGVHNIDVTWYLMGRPKPVRVVAQTADYIGNFKTRGVTRWEALDKEVTAFNTEDSAVALIFFENDAVMFVEAAWTLNGPGKNYTEIFGSKAGALLDPLTIYGENDQHFLADEKPQLPGWNRFAKELEHFMDCLESGETPRSSLEDGLTVQRMIDVMYRSAKEQREILL